MRRPFKKKINARKTEEAHTVQVVYSPVAIELLTDSGQTPQCVHLENDGTYRKKGIKVVRTNQTDHQQILLKLPCPLCKVVYASWMSHGKQNFIKSPHSQKFESPAQGYSVPAVDRDSPPLALKPGDKDALPSICDVSLVWNQLGKAYHALICGLILQNTQEDKFKALLIWADPPQEKMDPIEKLFDWYKIRLESETEYNNTKKYGAGVTTQIISAAFRACQTQATGSNTAGGQPYLSQDGLFERLRKALDRATGVQDTSNRGYNLHASYFRPSYTAKYWLNRYLALTVRMHVENVERKKHIFGPLSWEKILRKLKGFKAIHPPNWVELPNKQNVKRLAVIHVRRTPPSDQSIGRSMDKQNLQHVAKTIANVNRAIEARRSNAQQPRAEYTCLEPFSYVLLYGDFNYKDAESIKTDMEEHLQKCTEKISVGFISRPWQNNKAQETDKRVGPFWEKFSDPKFDYLPVQFKSLAIWVALCERYSPDICVIGHRSGFIEAAAFIGIPVFYLNNERVKITGKHDQPGELLWMRLAETAAYDRLREASDVINTLIPIESLASEREKDKNADEKAPLHVDPKYENELAAALFMFMCCVPTAKSGPANAVTPGGRPAWMDRVDIMHRAPGVGGTGLDREWLIRIYNDVLCDFRSHSM